MSGRPHVGGRDLLAATVVGVVLVATVAVALWWRSELFIAVVLVAVIAAFVDLTRVLDETRRPSRTVLIIASCAIMPASFLYGANGQIAGVLILLFGAVIWLLARDVTAIRLSRTAATVLAGVWVLVPASFALVIISADNGRLRLAAVIGVVALTDIAGYAVGVPFGRHKLSPRLSPNKTIEGLAGGVGVSVVVTALTWPLVFNGAAMWHGALFGFIVSVAAVFGDIAESGVKRALEVKDFGTFLPGHGGVLDRIDGLVFGLPVAAALFAVL